MFMPIDEELLARPVSVCLSVPFSKNSTGILFDQYLLLQILYFGPESVCYLSKISL
jgi:hypothetical protein